MASTAPLAPRANVPIGHAHDEAPAVNGNHVHNDPRPPPAPPAAGTPSKKDRKAKKALDSNEASKLVAQRISQLEHDAAGEKDQEAEIGACYFPPSTASRGYGMSGLEGPDEACGLWWGRQSRIELGASLAVRTCTFRLKHSHSVEQRRSSRRMTRRKSAQCPGRSCHTGTMLLMCGQCRAGGAQGES